MALLKEAAVPRNGSAAVKGQKDRQQKQIGQKPNGQKKQKGPKKPDPEQTARLVDQWTGLSGATNLSASKAKGKKVKAADFLRSKDKVVKQLMLFVADSKQFYPILVKLLDETPDETSMIAIANRLNQVCVQTGETGACFTLREGMLGQRLQEFYVSFKRNQKILLERVGESPRVTLDDINKIVADFKQEVDDFADPEHGPSDSVLSGISED